MTTGDGHRETIAQVLALHGAQAIGAGMRHPWDDEVFTAQAAIHEVDVTLLECDADVDVDGWLWEPGEPGTTGYYRMSGFPPTMPGFSFEHFDPPHLVMNIGAVTYLRWGSSRRLTMPEDMLPATVVAAMNPGMPLIDLIEVPGLKDVSVTEVRMQGDGYVELDLTPSKEKTT